VAAFQEGIIRKPFGKARVEVEAPSPADD